jgi:hypothetical protein
MQGRPSSSRPSTSARPTTAFDRDQFHHHQQHLQQQQSHEIEEESEEESDDEDVFAFLPPTTADQEQQPASQSPFTFGPVTYPEPTFDAWGRQYPTSPAIAPPLPPGIPSQTHPPPPLYDKPLISPPSPSTDSHPSTGISIPNFYRLKKLVTTIRTGSASTSGVASQNARLSSTQSSSFQRTAGPSHSQSNSQSQSQTYHQYRQQQHSGTGILGMPQAASSVADSLSMTQSMMEDGEGRSIK